MAPLGKEEALDGGWGWVIIVVSFIGQFLAYGSPHAVGVLYPEWLEAFGESKGKTAWVGSLVSGTGLIASPICNVFVSKFGARPVMILSGIMMGSGYILSSFAPNIQFLFFSYGVMVGLGCGLAYAATVTIICQYFDKRRGLALGIAATGTSFGGFVYASLQMELIKIYGLNGCLLIIGALSLNILVCGGPMRPLQLKGYSLKRKECQTVRMENLSVQDINDKNDKFGKCPENNAVLNVEIVNGGKKQTRFLERCSIAAVVKNKDAYFKYIQTSTELLQNRFFVSLCISMFLFDIGSFPPVLFMEDVAKNSGLTDEEYVFPLVSILSIMMGVGKLALGIIADLTWMNSYYLYAFTIGASGAALLCIPLACSYVTFAVISGILGFFSGNWSIFPYVTSKIVGTETLTHAYGVLMFFAGLGMLLGPPAIGWFYDWTQSYSAAFYFSGTCVLLGGFNLFLASLSCWDKNNSKNKRPNVKYVSSCDSVASFA
ncbi:monocarboxylate transporter 9b [Polypterus senegalus]|uniref:monocarboxylate transporter 9b n=1 Tax=Polypterus senegalus TaxID=55291 RepID=UPI001966946B|nr:monocarboxylate transporter 9b [Polypterus senegalus]XP_039627415.1 monocarboxylate transporter 9b [Polypterus senegalus]XP_039627424.1 monocarboxylate transporter 9b [Polypterus senegalus]